MRSEKHNYGVNKIWGYSRQIFETGTKKGFCSGLNCIITNVELGRQNRKKFIKSLKFLKFLRCPDFLAASIAFLNWACKSVPLILS